MHLINGFSKPYRPDNERHGSPEIIALYQSYSVLAFRCLTERIHHLFRTSISIYLNPMTIAEGHSACFYFHRQNPLRRMNNQKICFTLSCTRYSVFPMLCTPAFRPCWLES